MKSLELSIYFMFQFTYNAPLLMPIYFPIPSHFLLLIPIPVGPYSTYAAYLSIRELKSLVGIDYPVPYKIAINLRITY